MKELLTEWRKFINENYVDPRIQKQMAALIDGGYAIEINEMRGPSTRFKIIRLDYPRDEQRLLSLGYVVIGRSQDDDGKCLDAWSVYGSQAKQNKGLGPLLYEIALEWSSQNGGGLMADRSMVSDEALSVWDKYYRTRPEIRAKQFFHSLSSAQSCLIWSGIGTGSPSPSIRTNVICVEHTVFCVPL